MHEWLEQRERTYRIDPDRRYLTGVGMGGGGWSLTSAITAPVRPLTD